MIRYRQLLLFGRDDYMPVIGVTLDEDWIAKGHGPKPFTSIERKVLELSARNLSVKDIAAMLVKAESTIYTHRSRIVDKCPGCAGIDDVVSRLTNPNVQFESELAARRIKKQTTQAEDVG